MCVVKRVRRSRWQGRAGGRRREGRRRSPVTQKTTGCRGTIFAAARLAAFPCGGGAGPGGEVGARLAARRTGLLFTYTNSWRADCFCRRVLRAAWRTPPAGALLKEGRGLGERRAEAGHEF